MGLRGSEVSHWPGGRPRGWGGRSLTTARPRAAAPSLAPRARAGRGKRVGYPRGRGAAARPTPGTPATRSPGPPLPPAPGTRRSAPTSAARGAEAGPRSGLVGGHRHNALGRPLAARVPAEVRDWLRGIGQCRRVGLGTCLPGQGACSGPLHPVVHPQFFTELAPSPAGRPSEDLLKHLPPVLTWRPSATSSGSRGKPLQATENVHKKDQMFSPQKDGHLKYPETSATYEVNVAKVFSMTKYSGFRY